MDAEAERKATQQAFDDFFRTAYPTYCVAVEAKIARPLRSPESVAFSHEMPVSTLQTGVCVKILLEKAITELTEHCLLDGTDLFYLHWGCLSGAGPHLLKSWFYTEDELLGLFQMLPAMSTEPLPQVTLCFGVMEKRFQPLNHQEMNYVEEWFIAERHIRAILDDSTIGRLWSEDRLLHYEQYEAANLIDLEDSCIQKVAADGWQLLAACLLKGLDLLPLWILVLHGFDNGTSTIRAADKIDPEFEERMQSIIKQYPNMDQYVKANAEWLNTLTLARRVVSPFAWEQDCRRICECKGEVLPILMPVYKVSPPEHINFSIEHSLVRIEPGYQKFSKDPEKLFVLKRVQTDKTVAGTLSDDLKATPDDFGHPNLLNCIQAWVGTEYSGRSFMAMLYPTPETNLPNHMLRHRPTERFLRLELWQHMHNIADAMFYLHRPETVMKGWYHDISSEDILIFTKDDGKVIWKIGKLDSIILAQIGAHSKGDPFEADSDDENNRHPRKLYGRPPEITGREPSKVETRPSDVWSLGCIFLQVLVWAFRDDHNTSSWSSQMTICWEEGDYGTPELASWVDEALKALDVIDRYQIPFSVVTLLVSKMLAPDPAVRPGMQAIVHDLEKVYRRQLFHEQQEEYATDIESQGSPGPTAKFDEDSTPIHSMSVSTSEDEDAGLSVRGVDVRELLLGVQPSIMKHAPMLQSADTHGQSKGKSDPGQFAAPKSNSGLRDEIIDLMLSRSQARLRNIAKSENRED
ncbi:hypothetical protein AYO22_03066 [Fonsecaea multimorphosa]|nr:hypothetical protein AYO22_03066 [Fonsecaea multimorphosa]